MQHKQQNPRMQAPMIAISHIIEKMAHFRIFLHLSPIKTKNVTQAEK